MDGKSLDVKQQKIDELKCIFPEVFTEDKIDWEKLKATLGDGIEFQNERYVLNWAGKSDAFRTLQQQTTATLIPERNESVNFDTTENLFIEGENLEVLKILQKSYFGKVKMIYIDPPYNTGNDFIYSDKFAENREEYLKRTGTKDENGILLREGLFRNGKDNGHYHSNWLSMMYSRLFLARNLLREDGVIFVSIDDNEVHNLILLLNEIFGEENFISNLSIVNNMKGRNDKESIATCHEHLLIYKKSDFISYGLPFSEEKLKLFKYIDKNGNKYTLRDLRKRGRPDRRIDRPNMYFPIFYNKSTGKCSLEKMSKDDIVINPVRGDGSDGRWRWFTETVKRNIDLLEPRYSKKKKRWDIDYRIYLNPSFGPFYEDINEEEDDDDDSKYDRTTKSKSFWWGGEISSDVARREYKKLFPEYDSKEYPKSPYFMERVLQMGSRNSDIILDFFSGSCTTAHSALELNKKNNGNRKFIMVQMPEPCDEKSEAYKAGFQTIAEIGKERIRRVIKKIEKEDEGTLDFVKNKMDLGFKVFKLRQSNFKIWRSDEIKTEEELLNQMKLHLDPIVPEAKIEDILYELLLKSGKELTAPIEKEDSIYWINGNEMAMVLERIDDAMEQKIIAQKPVKFITLDRLFNGNDQLKTNTLLQMKDAGIETRVV